MKTLCLCNKMIVITANSVMQLILLPANRAVILQQDMQTCASVEPPAAAENACSIVI